MGTSIGFWYSIYFSVQFSLGKIPWRRERLSTPVFWRGEFHSLYNPVSSVQFSSVTQSCPTPWITARQASLSITNSLSSLKLMSIELAIPSSHLILCHPLLLPQSFPASGSSLMSQLFTLSGQSIRASASASVLPMNIQGWFPSELTGLFSLQAKGLSGVFSNSTVQKHQFFSTQLSLWSNSHIHTWPLGNHSFDYMDLCWQSSISAF